MDQTLAEQNSKCIAKSAPVKDDALDWNIFSKVAFAIYFNLKINLKTYPFLRNLKKFRAKTLPQVELEEETNSERTKVLSD